MENQRGIEIKSRLRKLGIKQGSLAPILSEKMGQPVTPSDISLALSGLTSQKKHERIRDELDALTTKEETQSDRH